MSLARYAFAVLALAFLLFATVVYAQGFTPLAPIDTGGAREDSFLGCEDAEIQSKQCLPKYLRTVYNTGIALAGLFLVFSIVRGGFELMFTDSILGKLEGKKIILQALGGAVIVYSSYLLMNALNPQLGRDLNLNLDFPRVKVKEIPVELRATLTDQQFELLREATARRDAELQGVAANLREEAGKLEEQATAETDPQTKARLLNEAKTKRQEAAQTDLTRVAVGAENLSVGEALKADTRQEIAAAVENATKSGGGIQQIRDAYTKARTDLAADPVQVLALYKKEMEDISIIQKHLAFGIIDNPPHDPNSAMVADETALTQQLSARINDIIAERDKQKKALIDFNAASQNLSVAQVQAQRQAVERVAAQQICQIKNKCRYNDYGYTKNKCENLRPDITCTY